MRNMIVATAVAAACFFSVNTHAADETTKVSGKTYVDFTNIDSKKNDVSQDNSGFGVDVTRFYVSVDHTFDDTWAADVTTDFQYSSSVGATEVFIKKAYLQAKLSDAFMLRVGSADMPWIPFVEGLYGYRYFEKTLTDRTGFATSADWGLHASGTVGNGVFNYAVSIVNGNGYKNLSRAKSMDFESRISIVPVKGLTLAVGYRTGKLGQDLESSGPENTASRVDALVAYVDSNFRVGGEYFTADNYSTALVKNAAVTDKADGYSVWGSVKVSKMVGIFAKYEDVKPSKDLSSSDKNQYYNLGVSIAPRKNVDLAIGYKYTKADAGANTTKTNEIGVWSQLAF
ncbi:MAG: porin [Steroidobacter sp.]